MSSCVSICSNYKNKPFRVMVAAITAMAFFVNIFAYELASAAQPNTNPVPSAKINLPEYLGYIKDQFNGTGDKLVIHIQDAHCNYAAQNTIANIIDYLNREYGINTVNLEGGEDGYDFSPFYNIKDKGLRSKVADYFLKEGEINAAEFYAVNNPGKINLWGVEDTGLYLDNLKVYRDSLKYKDEIDKSLKAVSYLLANLKVKIYSKELLAFDRKTNDFHNKAAELRDYAAYLGMLAKDKDINIAGLKNFDILAGTLLLEKGIDFKRANLERDQLIDDLNKCLSKNEIKELVRKAVEFKMGRIPPAEFYAYLTGKAKEVDIDIAKYKDLTLYIGYINIYSTLKKEAAFKEIEALEDRIKEKLYQSEDQRDLNRLGKHLSLIRNLLNITLTQEEFKYYQAHKKEISVESFIRFIEKIGTVPSSVIARRPKADEAISLSDMRRLDAHLARMEKFYELSYKRDKEFVNRLKGLSPNGTVPKATILITGGFHSENLATLFKKRGISYISIMPNFGLDDKECPYFKLLAGKGSIIQRYLRPAVSTLAYYAPFGNHAARVYGNGINEACANSVSDVADGKTPTEVQETPASSEVPSGVSQSDTSPTAPEEAQGEDHETRQFYPRPEGLGTPSQAKPRDSASGSPAATDEEILAEVRKLFNKEENVWTYFLNIRSRISNKNTIIEIAKLCAQENGRGTAEYFRIFGLSRDEDSVAIIEIAKLCAQQNSMGTALQFKNFGLSKNKDRSAIIEIAKLCARQNGMGTALQFKNFGLSMLKDRSAIIEIAKLCARQNGMGTALQFKNFGLSILKDRSAIIEIAKLCAQESGRGTAEYFRNFGLSRDEDSVAIIEIAKLCARQNGMGTALQFKNFGLSMPGDKIVIFILEAIAENITRPIQDSQSLSNPLFPLACMSNATTMVEEALASLNLSKLAIGTQSYVKLLLLEEAMKKQEISADFLKRLKEEAIPQLRVVEAISRGYPTLGMEVDKFIESKNAPETALAEFQVLVSNFLSMVQTPHNMGRSYLTIDEGMGEIRITPTVYPIFILLAAKLEELGVLAPAGDRDIMTYSSSVAGDYMKEAPLLLTTFFFSNYFRGDQNAHLRVGAGSESQTGDWVFPGLGGRFVGATVDPWTGALMDKSYQRTRGTQTNFFHSAIRVPFSLSPADYLKDDLARTFALTTAAAAYLNAYGIKDEGLKQLYGEFKSKITEFLREKFQAPKDIGTLLLGQAGTGQSYTHTEDSLVKVLKQIEEKFLQSDDSVRNAFRDLIDSHSRKILNYLYRDEAKEIIETALKGEIFGERIKILLTGMCFSNDKAVQEIGLAIASETFPEEYEKIATALEGYKPDEGRASSFAERQSSSGAASASAGDDTHGRYASADKSEDKSANGRDVSSITITRLPEDVKAVIFDMDDTLYESEELRSAYNRALYAFILQKGGAELGISTLEEAEERFKAKMGELGTESKTRTLQLLLPGVTFDEYNKYQKTAVDPADYLVYDSVLTAKLRELKDRNYRLAILTNNNKAQAERTLMKILGLTGPEQLTKFFDVIITRESVKEMKPSTEPFRKAMAELNELIPNILPQNCLSIGDKIETDITPALTMGMKAMPVKGSADIKGLVPYAPSQARASAPRTSEEMRGLGTESARQARDSASGTEEREKAVTGSFAAVREFGQPIRVIIPVLENIAEKAKFENLIHRLNSLLGKNGFKGSSVEYLEVSDDIEEVKKNFATVYGRTLDNLPEGGLVFCYVPEAIRAYADELKGKDGRVNVITDGLLDAQRPDIDARLALAHHLANRLRHPYNEEIERYTRDEILKLLERISADPEEIDKIKKNFSAIFKTFVLKIVPINWAEFGEYIDSQIKVLESA